MNEQALIFHEESNGIMPSVEWKRGRYNKPWYTGETLSVGIGQSFWTATPLQLTQALTTLVNHGERKVPHLLQATNELLPDGQVTTLPKNANSV